MASAPQDHYGLSQPVQAMALKAEAVPLLCPTAICLQSVSSCFTKLYRVGVALV